MQGPYSGAFASRVIGQNLEFLGPYHSVPAGAGAWRAGVGGLLTGRFGFADPTTGSVLNSQTDPSNAVGIVIPMQNVNRANGGVVGGPAAFGGPVAQWSWQTYDKLAKAWRLRQGIVTTLMDAGNFWLKFDGGANYGDTVYASLVDGSAISGTVDSAIGTAFVVCSNAGAGRLALVSSTARFNT